MQLLSKATWFSLHQGTNILDQVEPQRGWRWDQPDLHAPREPLQAALFWECGSGESPSPMLRRICSGFLISVLIETLCFCPKWNEGFTNLKPLFHKCYTLDKHKKEISSEIFTNRCALACFRPFLELKKYPFCPDPSISQSSGKSNYFTSTVCQRNRVQKAPSSEQISTS